MIPKIGDTVKLNHDFLKIWFGHLNYSEEVWKDKFKVTNVQDLENEFKIDFESKNLKYRLYILPNGEFSRDIYEYKGIQVFIPVNNKNDIYCSCGGPKKENYVFGEIFYICTICKKEKLI